MTKNLKQAHRSTARVQVRGLKRIIRRWHTARYLLPDRLWNMALRTSAYACALSRADCERLRVLMSDFLRAKSFEGASEMNVSEAMGARIALHACIPILNLGLDYYDDWLSIVIYPGDFRVHEEYTDESGVVHREFMDLCGQSQSQGPMVLSWEAVRQEDTSTTDRNLVIHECAHKLDVLNGDANGFPPLHEDMNAQAWARDFTDAFNKLHADLGVDRRSRIDAYAAEDPAEFFAVMSETFFTAPEHIFKTYPAVYRHLQQFYRQDPLSLLHNDTS